MADDKNNWRHVDRALYFPPNPDDPVVKLLGLYGIPYERICAAAAGAVYFTGKKRFEEYLISIFGVSSRERLPRTRAFWIEEGKEYACWKIQIFWKDYTGWIDAMWREEYDHYEVVTVWGNFADLIEDENIAKALIKGMELLRIIQGQMLKVGRPLGSGKFKSNEDFLNAFDEVMKKYTHKPSQPKVLEQLSWHDLWQGDPIDLSECQKNQKTLRNWLDRCDTTWEDMCSKYFPNS